MVGARDQQVLGPGGPVRQEVEGVVSLAVVAGRVGRREAGLDDGHVFHQRALAAIRVHPVGRIVCKGIISNFIILDKANVATD